MSTTRDRNQPRRSSEFWFESGDICIQALPIVFCVHKKMLSTDSRVFSELFSDLLSVPQPTMTIQGRPYIAIDDSPQDFEALLNVIYGTSYVPSNGIVTLNIIAPLIRIAHKYEMKELLGDTLGRLRTCFPTTWDGWKALTIDEKYSRFCLFSSVMTVDAKDDAITVVNLARLTDTIDILPTALYWCAQLKGNVVAKGTPRRDDSYECLSAADIACCIDARQGLWAVSHDIANRLFTFEPAPDCTSGRCQDSAERLPKIAHDYWALAGFHPFRPLRDWMEYVPKEKVSLCGLCMDLLYSQYDKAQCLVWEHLPEVMQQDHPHGWGNPYPPFYHTYLLRNVLTSHVG